MAVRYDFYTVYKGKEYRVWNDNGSARLVSSDADDLQIGFKEKIRDTENFKYTPEQLAKKIYTLNVPPSEIGDVYQIATFALYKGYEFSIINETSEDCYVLWASGSSPPELLEQLGFKQVDQGSFQRKIKKEEADLVYEKKTLLTDFFD